MDFPSRRTVLLVCTVMVVASRSFIIGNIDDHLQKYYTHPINNYEKKSEFIDTKYVGIDQHGQPYVNCTYNMDGVVGVRKCSLPPSETAFDMGFACFALWNSAGEIIAQDCWIHQLLSLEQCQKSGCNRPTGYDLVNFCCCFGHECNGKLNITSNHIRRGV